MKKIYSSIMAVALFASALSCTSGGNTNDAGTQTAQTIDEVVRIIEDLINQRR